MTTTSVSAPPDSSARARPQLAGIQHVGLTVCDVEASADWYQRVLGLQRQFDEPHHRSDEGGHAVVLGNASMTLNVGLDHHPANAGEQFDPTRTGLDHVCFHVTSVDDLHAWASHLDGEGVAHSGVYRMEGLPVWLLTFRDPDGIQLELMAVDTGAGSNSVTSPTVIDEVLARHFAAEAAHDRPGILATLTDDAEHEPVGFPGAPFHGHDELIRFYDVLFDELEQSEIVPIRRLYGPDFVVDEVQYRGRAFNGFMGFDCGDGGKPVDFRLLHVCEFEGDRMCREQVWLDVNAIRAQVG